MLLIMICRIKKMGELQMKKVECAKCNGKGFEEVQYSFRTENGFVMQDAIETCNFCNGKGLVEIMSKQG